MALGSRTAHSRLRADLKNDPRIGKYLLFFHGSGPEDERTMFDNFASIGLAWSDDLKNWNWPGKTPSASDAVKSKASGQSK